MNQRIDLEAFTAHLADDDRLAHEIASLAVPAQRSAAVEIAALEVELWAVEARDTGDWAAFGARIRDSLTRAVEDL